MPSRPGHGDAASSRVTPTLPRTSAALPGGPSLRDGPCKAESEGIPLPYSTPRHLLQYVTWRAKANGMMKLRRFTKRLRYRCGRCFANFNHPFQTRDGRACRGRHEDAEGAQRAQCPNSSAPAVARPPWRDFPVSRTMTRVAACASFIARAPPSAIPLVLL